jgi:glycerol kinase
MHWKAVVSADIHMSDSLPWILKRLGVAVAGSAIKWLRDTMRMISSAAEVNHLAARENDTAGVYFVTAFSGLLAPYWDPGAAGLLIGMEPFLEYV